MEWQFRAMATVPLPPLYTSIRVQSLTANNLNYKSRLKSIQNLVNLRTKLNNQQMAKFPERLVTPRTLQMNIWKIMYSNCGKRYEDMNCLHILMFSYLSPQFKYMIFYIFICILHLLRAYYELKMWPAPGWFDSSVGRALHRFFQALISQLIKSCVYLRWSIMSSFLALCWVFYSVKIYCSYSSMLLVCLRKGSPSFVLK